MPKIEIMSHRGDDLFAEWGADTKVEDIKAIAEWFKEQRGKGFSAFTAQTGNRVDEFNPDIHENIIFIAPLIGG
jgi:hypothetical protein